MQETVHLTQYFVRGSSGFADNDGIDNSHLILSSSRSRQGTVDIIHTSTSNVYSEIQAHPPSTYLSTALFAQQEVAHMSNEIKYSRFTETGEVRRKNVIHHMVYPTVANGVIPTLQRYYY